MTATARSVNPMALVVPLLLAFAAALAAGLLLTDRSATGGAASATPIGLGEPSVARVAAPAPIADLQAQARKRRATGTAGGRATAPATPDAGRRAPVAPSVVTPRSQPRVTPQTIVPVRPQGGVPERNAVVQPDRTTKSKPPVIVEEGVTID